MLLCQHIAEFGSDAGILEGVRATVPDVALSMCLTVVEPQRGRRTVERVRDARVPCDPVAGYPSLTVMIPLLGGVQLLSLRVIGEYLGRIFNETRRPPLYLLTSYLAAAWKRVITHRSGQLVTRGFGGAPDRSRTCDLWLRKPTLYPTELRAHAAEFYRVAGTGVHRGSLARSRRTL